jgi:4-hydroxy-4-methyl-2-oxoglutarate aldolase
MTEVDLSALGSLTTAIVCDALVRLDRPIRTAPPELRPLASGMRVAGAARPVRHYGSVDVFLEAIDRARPGEVLVIDNGNRADEGCIGDLAALEAKTAGIAGAVVWGRHRDSAELREIGWPLFSTGGCAVGPREMRQTEEEAFEMARVGSVEVRAGDVVLADDDAVLFLDPEELDEIIAVAQGIATTERGQAARMSGGESLRKQLQWSDYVHARRERPTLTFREHIRRIGGAIEE